MSTSCLRTVLLAAMLAAGSLGILTGPQPAAARSTGAKRAMARKHFERGETFYRQGEFRKALAEYKKALNFKRYPAFLFNIGQCHRQLDEPKKALFFYKLYLSEQPTAPNKAEVVRRIQQMERRIKELQNQAQQVGRLSVITQPRGASILVDQLKGPAQATSPAILPKIRAGEHLVVVRLDGYREVTRKVQVKGGQLALLEVTLQPLVAPRRVEPRRVEPRRVEPRRTGPRRVVPLPGPAPVVKRTAPYYKRWWFWTGLAVTVGLAAGSAGMGVYALELKKRYDRDTTAIPRLDGIKRDAERAAGICDALWVGAAVVGLTTIISAAVVGKGRPERAARVDRTRITPSCSATGCSLVVQGRF